LTDFGFAILAVMFRYADLIEQPVELVDDGVYLLGQVAGVHFGRVHGVSSGRIQFEEQRRDAAVAFGSQRELSVVLGGILVRGEMVEIMEGRIRSRASVSLKRKSKC
jgi:hypothetical protein